MNLVANWLVFFDLTPFLACNQPRFTGPISYELHSAAPTAPRSTRSSGGPEIQQNSPQRYCIERPRRQDCKRGVPAATARIHVFLRRLISVPGAQDVALKPPRRASNARAIGDLRWLTDGWGNSRGDLAIRLEAVSFAPPRLKIRFLSLGDKVSRQTPRGLIARCVRRAPAI